MREHRFKPHGQIKSTQLIAWEKRDSNLPQRWETYITKLM